KKLLWHVAEARWLREVVVLHVNEKDVADGRRERGKGPILQNVELRPARQGQRRTPAQANDRPGGAEQDEQPDPPEARDPADEVADEPSRQHGGDDQGRNGQLLLLPPRWLLLARREPGMHPLADGLGGGRHGEVSDPSGGKIEHTAQGGQSSPRGKAL